jgi:hypothetical protein
MVKLWWEKVTGKETRGMEVGENKMGHRRHNEEENRLPRRNYYS